MLAVRESIGTIMPIDFGRQRERAKALIMRLLARGLACAARSTNDAALRPGC